MRFSNEEMAANASFSGQSHLDSTSLNDQSLSNRSINRSTRVVEMVRRKNEADEPFVQAWKYFSDGQSAPFPHTYSTILLEWTAACKVAVLCVHGVSSQSMAVHLLFLRRWEPAPRVH